MQSANRCSLDPDNGVLAIPTFDRVVRQTGERRRSDCYAVGYRAAGLSVTKR